MKTSLCYSKTLLLLLCIMTLNSPVKVQASPSAEHTFKLMNKQIHTNQRAFYVFIADEGKTFAAKSEINIVTTTQGVELDYRSEADELYKYDKDKKRLIIGNKPVKQVIVSVGISKNTTASTVQLYHIVDDQMYGPLDIAINAGPQKQKDANTIAKEVANILSTNAKNTAKKVTISATEKTINSITEPAKYTIKIKGENLKKEDEIFVITPADAPKLVFKPDAENANFNNNIIKLTKDTEALDVEVQQHPDTHLIEDVKVPITHIYNTQSLPPVTITQKGNSFGATCTTLSLQGLYSQPGHGCFNFHLGFLTSFNEDVDLSPKPYGLFVARHSINNPFDNSCESEASQKRKKLKNKQQILDNEYTKQLDKLKQAQQESSKIHESLALISEQQKTAKQEEKDIENTLYDCKRNKLIGEGYFEADLYDIPALIEEDTAVPATQDTDKKHLINDSTIFRIATGSKFSITDTTNINLKLEAKRIPSNSESIHRIPLSYEVGIERSVSFGNDNVGRGTAGISWAKDEFWQYHDNNGNFVNNKERFKIYGTIALNDTRTILLHAFIDTGTKGNGPGLAGIRITYGGNWEKFIGNLIAD